jgi:mannose-6-phosphate isomerase-like protein (cupin superfamily)
MLEGSAMDDFHVNFKQIQELEAPAPYTRTVKILFDRENNPKLPFCAGLFRLKPGQKGPPHKHEEEIEIYVILQGQGTVTFDNKDVYPLTPQDMIWVPPKTLHETVSTGDEDLLLLGIFIPPIGFSEMKEKWKLI